MILGKVIKLNIDPMIDINDNMEYSILGVRAYGKGVLVKRRVLGNELNMKKYKIAKKNQLMWCKVDTKNGAFGVVRKEHEGCLASMNMALADIDTNIANPDFIELLFRNPFFYRYINSKSTGTTNRKYLTPSQVCAELEIPNLGREEQESFLARYKKFESSRIHTNIIKNQEQVRKLRQAILQEAISGKLVPQDPKDEPASELLRKIKAEKEQLINEKKICEEKELPPISEKEIPFELPGGWEWTRLGEICCGITSGSTPSKDQFCTKGGIPYLKVYNIVNNKIDFNVKPQYIAETVHRTKNKRSILYPDDVIMNIVGPPLGKIAIIPSDYPEWNCNQAIVFFRPFIKGLSNWIYTFLCEGSFLDSIELIGTAGQDNISVTKSKKIIIPIAPLLEQKLIVQKVDQLMILCNKLEQKIRENQKSSEFLMEAVLKEAFAS